MDTEIKNFKIFLQKNKCIIPNEFITNYYIEMERIVKDFSNQELQRLQNENAKLKRNLNPITVSNKEGLYVWHEDQILKYRIGSGEILKRRIKQHNFTNL